MARVTVTLPPLLTDPSLAQGAVISIASEAVRVSMTKTLGEMKKTSSTKRRPGSVPANTGALSRSLSVQPVRVQAGKVKTGIQSPLPYAPIMDSGRQPGRRLWWGWLLYGRGAERNPEGWKTGWVRRQMRAVVDEYARNLQAAYISTHKKKRKGVNRSIDKYQKQAAFLLARSIARKIVARGIKGRRYAARYAPGGDKHIGLLDSIQREFTATAKRQGFIK
jgi:hypothetical protein